MATHPDHYQPMPDFSDEAQLAVERASDLGYPSSYDSELEGLQNDHARGSAPTGSLLPDNNGGYPLISTPGVSRVRSYASDPRGGYNADNTVADEHTWTVSRDPLLTPTSEARQLVDAALVQSVVPEVVIEAPESPDILQIKESARGKAAEIMKHALPTIVNKPEEPAPRSHRHYTAVQPEVTDEPAHNREAMIAAAAASWDLDT